MDERHAGPREPIWNVRHRFALSPSFENFRGCSADRAEDPDAMPEPDVDSGGQPFRTSLVDVLDEVAIVATLSATPETFEARRSTAEPYMLTLQAT